MEPAGIIALLTGLVGLVMWWLKKRDTKQNDPVQQNQERKAEIAEEVIRRDGEAINRSLDDDLHELRTLQGDQQRSNGDSAEGR